MLLQGKFWATVFNILRRCETCGELVCYECILKGGEHCDHGYGKITQAFSKYKEEIVASLEPMEKQVAIIEKALLGLDIRCGEIADQRTATEDSIHVTFRRLREVLNVRETELIGQLHQMTQEKLKGLAAHEGPDRDHPSPAEELSPLHAGES